jgi:hypothetical protein
LSKRRRTSEDHERLSTILALSFGSPRSGEAGAATLLAFLVQANCGSSKAERNCGSLIKADAGRDLRGKFLGNHGVLLERGVSLCEESLV